MVCTYKESVWWVKQRCVRWLQWRGRVWFTWGIKWEAAQQAAAPRARALRSAAARPAPAGAALSAAGEAGHGAA